MSTKKRFYNIEGTIRSGFKLSGDYETLDFSFTKLSDSGVNALVGSRSIKQLKRLTISNNKSENASGDISFGGGIGSDGSTLIIINSILWNNSPEQIFFNGDINYLGVFYSDIEGEEEILEDFIPNS